MAIKPSEISPEAIVAAAAKLEQQQQLGAAFGGLVDSIADDVAQTRHDVRTITLILVIWFVLALLGGVTFLIVFLSTP